MARLNLTLDRDTYAELDEHARRAHQPRARVARELLVEGLARRAALDRRNRLARDYAAGRSDARALLNDFESGQADLLGDENN
jgi:hypothetical protein